MARGEIIYPFTDEDRLMRRVDILGTPEGPDLELLITDPGLITGLALRNKDWLDGWNSAMIHRIDGEEAKHLPVTLERICLNMIRVGDLLEWIKRGRWSGEGLELTREIIEALIAGLDTQKGVLRLHPRLMTAPFYDELAMIGAGVGHDLRGPLGNMKSYLDYLSDGEELDKGIWNRSIAAAVNSYIAWASRLVGVARGDDGLVLTDLDKVFDKDLRMVLSALPWHEINRENIGLKNLSKQVTRPGDWTKILTNLFNNAYYVARERTLAGENRLPLRLRYGAWIYWGEREIKLRGIARKEPMPMLRFLLIDWAGGFRNMFDGLGRLKVGRTRRQGGTGLGMMIVTEIAGGWGDGTTLTYGNHGVNLSNPDGAYIQIDTPVLVEDTAWNKGGDLLIV